MISTDDFCWFVDRTLDQMVRILNDLGDDRASERPDLPGANSPYGIVTHCLGVMASWGGHFVAGRTVVRNRDSEFQAHGSVNELISRMTEARRALREDVAVAEMAAVPRNLPGEPDAHLPVGRTQGGALFHMYEELAQHLGQMEITRDLLIAEPSAERLL